MLRKRKIKPKEQKAAEEFFPVDAEDIKRTTEKIVREIPSSNILGAVTKIIKTEEKQVEKAIKSLTKPRSRVKRPKKITEEKKEYSPSKIILKQGGYEMIITEKPQAALKIANALGKALGKDVRGVPYYEVNRQGKKIIVACAVGHLFTLRQNNPSQKLPVFDISWVPNYLALKKDFTKRYYDTLMKLAKDAGSITIATDYDIEGEVIGLNVMRFICNQKDANRMKFSTLTDKELDEAYISKANSLNWGQAIAGETRHYLDWFYGINLSRALMNAIKLTGKFKIMSIGRVQGPALNLIVKKEREIEAFKPQTYWQAFITLAKPAVELKYVKDIFDKAELSKFDNIIGKKATVTTTKSQQVIPPNPPFNLTNLQTEAYALHGITPSAALRAAQSLYLAGLISYPRTSSQKLPDSIDYTTILKKLARQYNTESLIKRSAPVEGKKTDPAHPSIYPTGNTQNLDGDEAKVYNLIARRFISLFCGDAVVDNKNIKAEVNIEGKIANDKTNKLRGKIGDKDSAINSNINNNTNKRAAVSGASAKKGERDNILIFSARGSAIADKGWMEVYPTKIIEKTLPDANGEIKIGKSRAEEKETQPPHRYSPASILSELEKRNLGTKATRAAILETLYDRGYVKEKSIEATPLGISLISTLERHSPIIINEELTRSFEKDMDQILQSKKDLNVKEEKVKEKAKQAITEITTQFEKEGSKIGEELMEAQEEERQNQREKNKIMLCPVCNKGSLAITYSKKNRKFFIACNAYPDCKTTYSLPPFGTVKKLEPEKLCEKCNYPMLMSLQKGKKPWIFCFNRECPTNQERLKKYREKKEQENKNANS
jgi:DNA topoisomerase-1